MLPSSLSSVIYNHTDHQMQTPGFLNSMESNDRSSRKRGKGGKLGIVGGIFKTYKRLKKKSTKKINRENGRQQRRNCIRKSIDASLDRLNLGTKPSDSSRYEMMQKIEKLVERENEIEEGSEDEYPGNLLDTYIGQIGACTALGLKPEDVLNMEAWNNFSEAERQSLLAHLPEQLSGPEKDETVKQLLNGKNMYFGTPRDKCYLDVAAGRSHPRVKRWRKRVEIMERRHHMLTLQQFHSRKRKELLARKAVWKEEPNRTQQMKRSRTDVGNKTAEDVEEMPTFDVVYSGSFRRSEWDEGKWEKVEQFRRAEALRYSKPHNAFIFVCDWGTASVAPLKKIRFSPGVQATSHPLLRDDRPNHVTLVSLVRDAASRLPHGCGTRAAICNLLLESQFIGEDVTFEQANKSMSKALDRLRIDVDQPIKFDNTRKQWVYLHLHKSVEELERSL